MRAGSAIMAILRDNSSMRQLQFFTTAELGRMRDRTASRNHSPERDEFRRMHAHHRAWGLVQRHGRRLRHLRTSSCTPRPARTPENGRQAGVPGSGPGSGARCLSSGNPQRRRGARPQQRISPRATSTSQPVRSPCPATTHRPRGATCPAQAPAAHPRRERRHPTASRGSDRNAEAGKPTPRPPRHRHRPARKMVTGVAIHAHPNPITCHPLIAPERPAKARSP